MNMTFATMGKRLLWLSLCGLSWTAGLSLANSQNLDETPIALQRAFESAWNRSSIAAGLASRFNESEAAINAANSWVAGSPSVGITQRFDQSTGSADVGYRESELSIATPVWWPAQKFARQTVASSAAEELQAQTQQAKLELANQVREAYWLVAIAQEDMHELEDHVQHLVEISSDVARRVSAGDLARSDALLADQEVRHAQTQWTQAKIEYSKRKAEYKKLTGHEAPLVFLVEPHRPANTNHPRLALTRAALSKAQSNLELANQSSAVTPTVGVSMRNERDNLSPVSRALGVHLQIPIGTDIQLKPLQAEAKTRIAVAQAELNQVEATLATEIETAKLQLELELQGLEQATERSTLAAEHLGLIKKAFDLGDRGLIDLLRAQVLSHESTSAQSKQHIKVNLAISRLNQTNGVLP